MSSELQKQLEALNKNNGLRKITPSTTNACHIHMEGDHTPLLNLSGNDYLGLAGNSDIQKSFFDLTQSQLSNQSNWMSASSSRALTGSTIAHKELENSLADAYQKESALLFNSGYHANTGILPALTGKNDLILADKLVHASIIDGLRMAKADFKRFAHNSANHAKQLLEKYRKQYDNVWLVTESVFSMDGDVAPLNQLVALKQEFDLALYVDEAHGAGCYGESGLGVCETTNSTKDIDIIVGTFGKALAGYGGYAVCSDLYKSSLVNFSRSWLFSTALPPITIQWNHYIWQQLDNLNKERKQLTHLSDKLRSLLQSLSLETSGKSHIVPLIYGGNDNVITITDALRKKGILALPIRSPTVKAGTERIRFSLSADLPESCLSTIKETLTYYAA